VRQDGEVDPHVEIAEGTAFEVLLGAASIADENWRDVFANGAATYANALAVAGPALVTQVTNVGRFGWINLVSLLTRSPQPWDLRHLVTAVHATAATELHYITVGGERRQLVQAIAERTIRAALAGDGPARERLTAAFASERLVARATPWLLNSASEDVKTAVLDVLSTWQARLLRPSDEVAMSVTLQEHSARARAELVKVGGAAFLAQVAAGVHYDPPDLDRVLLISSLHVAPIIVVVDGRQQHVILHPAVGDAAPTFDAARRLLELSRAVGDKTRVKILTVLRQGEMTAVDLARALGVPRTTLLHHLALLRSAGLIHVAVTPGDATMYRLRPDGLSELAKAAAVFISTE
jgi:DNA-binding transcriptional ArsR family regulator